MQEASKRYRTLFLPGFLETDEARAAVERRLDAVHYWDRRGGMLLVGRTKRSIAVIAAVVALSGGGTALGVALSRDGSPHRPRRRQTTEAEVVVTTSEEIVAPATEPATTVPASVLRRNLCPRRRPRQPPRRPHLKRQRRRTSRPLPGDDAKAGKAQAESRSSPRRCRHEGADRDDHAGSGASVSSNGARIGFTSNEAGAKSPASSMPLPTPRARAPTCSPVSSLGTTRSRSARRIRPETWGSRQASPGVHPAGHDASHRDARIDPAGVDDADERELHLHRQRGRRRLRVLARRGGYAGC